MSASRTERSITNAKVSLFFLIATFLLNFFSRKLFLDGLGAEVMGMRTTIWTFLGMLSLSELGIASAISAALYKPLAERNYTAINEIVSILGWLYTRVFGFITLGLIVFLFFMPSLLGDMKAPIEYAYMTIVAFFIGTMLSYTVNYKSIILSADQKHYKINYITQGSIVVKGIVQVLILLYLPNPYIYWVLTDIIFSAGSVYFVDRITRKEYSWLEIKKGQGREYLKKYPEILKQTGQLFVYNISVFIFSQSSQALIPVIVSISAVTFYENYKNLVANTRAAIYAVFTNLGSGTANLIAEGNKEKIYSFFWEITSLLYLIGGIGAFGIFSFSDDFISLWLGDSYILPQTTLLVLSLTAYLDYTRGSIDAYIFGYRLFKDVWSSIALGIIIIGLSFLFGKYIGWGTTGILLGNYIGLVLIIKIWKPFYIFKSIFNHSPFEYFKGIIKFPLITFSLAWLFNKGIDYLELNLNNSYLHFLLHVTWITGLFATILYLAFYATSSGFRRMSVRLKAIAINALNKLPFVQIAN